MKKISTRLWISFWLILITIPVIASQNHSEDEHLFKAIFIYNFAKFTDWPEAVWKEHNAPLVLCTTGKDELVDGLNWLGGKVVSGHIVHILSLKNTVDSKSCHVLYIALSEQGHYKDILKSMEGRSVLTISKIPHFAGSGGIVELYRKDARTLFIIDLGLARKVGLMLSASLLNMAVVVGEAKQ